MQSPKAILFNTILEQIKLKAPIIRYIDQDLGQLENYGLRPEVSWPCCLIDIEDFKYTDIQAGYSQLAEGIVSLRIGLVKYTESNNLTPTNIRSNALAYYDTEHVVFKALHGWAPSGFSKLLRRADGTEKRDDDIRVRVVKFAISFTDESAKPNSVKVLRPDATFGI